MKGLKMFQKYKCKYEYIISIIDGILMIIDGVITVVSLGSVHTGLSYKFTITVWARVQKHCAKNK